jgi:hypothetical protein
MEVTQRLQPVQDEACQLFEETEGQGEELEQVVTAVEQFLEGPVNEAVIQECTHISCPMRSRILWLYSCRILTEDNKREEGLVGVAPGSE